jgi:predicted nucleic acid-binding protein
MAAQQVICDTDVMIDFWEPKNQRHNATKKTIEIKIGVDNIVLTAITKIELLKGAVNKADIQKISSKLSRFNIELINADITLKAFSLIEKYSLSNGLALPDGFIAATAIVMDLQLFTYNVKDYKFIDGLSLYS